MELSKQLKCKDLVQSSWESQEEDYKNFKDEGDYESLYDYVNQTALSFDKVEKDKKVELLKLTLYKNLAISETMDMVDLLSKQPKLNQVNMLASPQRCKVTIENDLPVDLVKIKRSLQSKKKKFINFISISD